MISEHFSRAGFSVQTAEDGLSGVQMALELTNRLHEVRDRAEARRAVEATP